MCSGLSQFIFSNWKCEHVKSKRGYNLINLMLYYLAFHLLKIMNNVYFVNVHSVRSITQPPNTSSQKHKLLDENRNLIPTFTALLVYISTFALYFMDSSFLGKTSPTTRRTGREVLLKVILCLKPKKIY